MIQNQSIVYQSLQDKDTRIRQRNFQEKLLNRLTQYVRLENKSLFFSCFTIFLKKGKFDCLRNRTSEKGLCNSFIDLHFKKKRKKKLLRTRTNTNIYFLSLRHNQEQYKRCKVKFLLKRIMNGVFLFFIKKSKCYGILKRGCWKFSFFWAFIPVDAPHSDELDRVLK